MDNNEHELEDNFEIDAETLKKFNAFVEEMKTQKVLGDNEYGYIVNPSGMKDMADAYKLLCYLTKGTSARVVCERDFPSPLSGSIYVIGRNPTFSNTKLFVKAAKLATNLDVYLKFDGTVMMEFSFFDLMTPIK